jgi:hypothetical protein
MGAVLKREKVKSSFLEWGRKGVPYVWFTDKNKDHWLFRHNADTDQVDIPINNKVRPCLPYHSLHCCGSRSESARKQNDLHIWILFRIRYQTLDPESNMNPDLK